MNIQIPSTGKPCKKCKERDGNPLHNGICNVCYSNDLLGEPQKINEVNRPSVWEERALWIIVGIFLTIGIIWLANSI